MTTIVWDGETLATDSYAIADEVVVNHSTQKIFKNMGGFSAVTFAGNYQDAICAMNVENFNIHCEMPEGACVIYGLTETGTLYECDLALNPRRFILSDVPVAGGTGWKLALAAMDAGADAVEAVEIAIKRDIYSGGDVQCFRLED